MKLLVIVGSTRPGRVGRPIADWVIEQAGQHGGFEVELADLAEIDLPLFDEPVHPSQGRYQHQHTKDWSAQVAAADAFVYVMPEYNHSYNAALKNAIDYLNREWAYKPVGLVSYGGVSGGIRSVQATKLMLTSLKVMPIPEAVTIPFFFKMMNEGVFNGSEELEKAIPSMLDELHKWAVACKTMR